MKVGSQAARLQVIPEGVGPCQGGVCTLSAGFLGHSWARQIEAIAVGWPRALVCPCFLIAAPLG
jgi:hypothetical protein